MTKERARQKAIKYLEWANLADKKRKELSDIWYAMYKDFDWTEPIKLGHHSQRRHEKVFERRDSFFRTQIELEEKAKRFREKAENLNYFANTNKGDAQRRREAKWAELDKIVSIGSRVRWVFGGKEATVKKVNRKTYGVEFEDGRRITDQKDFFTPINN